MKNFEEMEKYLREHNKKLDKLDYLIEEGYFSKSWYEAILYMLLEDKPKRVIDVGCCLGLFSYMFENEGIEYIGIDLNKYNRYESEKVKYIQGDYLDLVDEFKDDVIISVLCIGYLIDIKDVKAKRLIINDLEFAHTMKYGTIPIAREIKLDQNNTWGDKSWWEELAIRLD